MKARVLVVGSGASGVHFALSLLRRGQRVTMVDVGGPGPGPVAPHLDFTGLRERLDDASGYFLGSRFEGVSLPGEDDGASAIPPSKGHVLASHRDLPYEASGFAPRTSFARGGLGEAWSAGCHPFNPEELADFPIPYADLAAGYDEVARRIGVSGEIDDLAEFIPLHGHLQPPLELDAHSRLLLESYGTKREALRDGPGAYLGRSRIAVLTRPIGSRSACGYTGRCLWGCPSGALYTPSTTLRECLTYETFTYLPDLRVDYFRPGPAGSRVVVVRPADGGGTETQITADRLVLAAGTLNTSRIVLRSILRASGERATLSGLMDNRCVEIPFLNLAMLGRDFSPNGFPLHLLGMGLPGATGRDYVHGRITTLTAALIHSIARKLPFDLRTSTLATRALHSALGLVTLTLPDTRREGNFVTLPPASGTGEAPIGIRYAADDAEPGRIREVVSRVRGALGKLGCFVPPGVTRVRPMGTSASYAGTLPMSRNGGDLTTNEFGESRDFANVFVVDGSTFPFLPAKGAAFTLMANAVRVADAAF